MKDEKLKEFNKKYKPLRLNLQHFADQSGEDTTPPTDNGSVNTITPSGGDNTPPTSGDTVADNNTPNQDEVIKKAQQELLKTLGVEDLDTLKSSLEEYKKIQESSKTEAEKQAEALKVAQKKLEQYETERINYEGQIAALKKGVADDKVNDVITLAKASGKENLEEAIDEIIKKYPNFLESTTENTNNTGKLPKFGQPGYNGSGQEPNMFEQMVQAMGGKVTNK